MKVLTLSEFGEEKFLSTLEDLDVAEKNLESRNSDWFSHLKKIYNRRFNEWFFLVDNNQVAAFATVQEYYPGCYRLLTRTYIFPEYRRFRLPNNDKYISPSMYLLPVQLDYLRKYDTVMISMQDAKRRKSIERLATKFNNNFNHTWSIHPRMVKTCDNVSSQDCWQSIIYMGEPPLLDNISINEWKKL